MFDNKMAYAATFVVVLYLAQVIWQRASAPWYEWLMAILGAGTALWFWVAQWRRQRRKNGRGQPR